MSKPYIIKGEKYTDSRGIICFNNSFSLAKIKRIYEIQNSTTSIERGWKGHLIESRWFLCSKGEISIKIKQIKPNDHTLFEKTAEYNLKENSFDVLYVPPGYATLIKQKKRKSKLIAFSDHFIQDSEKEYRWKK